MSFDVDWTWLLIITATFFLAGIVKGVIGLGLPTIAMALLSSLVSPAQAAAMLVAPTVLTNFWQMLDGPHLKTLFRRLWPMMIGVLVGTLATSRIVAATDSQLSTALVGVVLVIYALTALAGWQVRIPPRAEPMLTPLCGLATGLVNGATAIFVLPIVPYLQGIGLDKNALVQAFGLFAFMASASLGFGLAYHGMASTELILPGAAAVAAAFAGMSAGRHLRARLSIERFRRFVLIGLIGLAASMIHRGLR